MHDVFDMEKLSSLVRRYRPFVVWASPPCQGYSGAPNLGVPSKVERLIPLLRDMLNDLGVPFVIENVVGARSEMSSDAISVWGQMFGQHQDRERYLEGGGGLKLFHETCLLDGAQALRRGSCLGRNRRFPRHDFFGRSISTKGRRVCCEGNIHATQGSTCHAGTLTDHAASMGVDVGHMSYAELAQAVLPDYSSFAVGQAAMHVLRTRFGMPVSSFTEMLADPERASTIMRHWRRGAGGTSPSLGLRFEASQPRTQTGTVVEQETAPLRGLFDDAATPDSVNIWRPQVEIGMLDRWSLDDAEFRELDYTHAGSYDRAVIWGDAPNWSARFRPCPRKDRGCLTSGALASFNVFAHLPGEGEGDFVAELCTGARARLLGRMTVIVSSRWVQRLEEVGFRRVRHWRAGCTQVVGSSREPGRMPDSSVALSFGRRECPPGGLFLDHVEVKPAMDPRDRGAPGHGAGYKAALAWSPFHRHPERWKGKGLPDDVVRMMMEGVTVEAVGDDELFAHEFSQYAFRDSEHFVRGSHECDRALIAGHLELVPDDEVEWALAHGSVHPWTVVHQSAEKWRSCQDYKHGTNPRVISSPFALCSALDVRKVVRPDSHFAKFDLRDGFWSVPVSVSSRHHLMVRHPATGRLLRCTSLPFGYAKSPQHFCRVTEAVAQLFRRRVAGMGIHVFCFVDDYLLVGDTRALTVLAMDMFMDLLSELGLPFAAHKTRGPTQVVEFLGFLLANAGNCRCIALTASRQRRLEEMLREWADWEPPPGRPPGMVEPKTLAVLLGHMVFASAVIPGGRVFMQAMLRQFKGLEVDWSRGLVRHVNSAWSRVRLDDGFWRDVHWLRSALSRRNCIPFDEPQVGELAIIGTDASDYACGELAWLDGGREETTLVFTSAERRRPINFRELRGTLRACEVFGWRAAGRLLLVETDNTFGHEAASKMRCKTEDSQELVRRIHELALKYNFSIRSVHTPGVSLVRPDQTSRGTPPEEPRLRLSREEFEPLASRFGPFDEFLGAERELQPAAVLGSRAFRRLWAHPSYDTVGSTLRLICDRLSSDTSTCARGVVVVPFSPEAGWWKLTRHFACVGEWGAGRLRLEAAELSSWQPASNQRRALLLAFPRAGALLTPLGDAVALGEPEARAELSLARSALGQTALSRVASAWVNVDSQLPVGTLLYSPRRLNPSEVWSQGGDKGCAGVLYLTTEAFDGKGRPSCAELRRVAGQRHQFSLGKGSYHPSGAPWSPHASALWVVNHLGGRMHVQPPGARRGRSEDVRYLFDFDRAEDEIVHLRAVLREMDDTGCVADGRLADDVLGDLVELPFSTTPPPPPSRSATAASASVSSGDSGLSGYSVIGLDPDSAGPADLGCLSLSSADDEVSPMSGYGEGRHSWVTARKRREGSVESRLLSPRLPSVPPPAAGITQPSSCRYSGMLCWGCGDELGFGSWCIPGGCGMVHNQMSCYKSATGQRAARAAALFEGQAEQARREERDGPATGPTEEVTPTDNLPPVDLSGSTRAGPVDEATPAEPPPRVLNQRGTQLIESLSVDRRLMVRACLEGRCAHVGSDEPIMTCIGSCHRQLHGVKCAQITHGHAIIGCFECPDCRLRKIFGRTQSAAQPYPEAAIKDAEETMLLELSRGAEGTGSGYADYVQLESRWALDVGGGEKIKLPSDSPEALKLFLTWLVREAERPRSLGGLWRIMGSYMMRTGRPNLTADSGVRAHYSSLLDEHGVEEQPRTAATPRMIFHLFDSVIVKHCPREFICARTSLDVCLEAGCGLRVGEALSGGDYHGLLAGNVSLLRRVDTGLVTVEGKLEHSKTKFQRFVNCLGTTLGTAKLPFEQTLRRYWKEAGMRVVSLPAHGGYEVTTVDYYVVRVSFLGMDQNRFDNLLKLLPLSAVAEVRKHTASLAERARSRYGAKHSKDKRYINLIGGHFGCDEINTVVRELNEAGYGETATSQGFVSVVMGPLLRSTDGAHVNHMPLDPSSTYKTLHKMMDDAYELANSVGDPDPWLDLQGLDEPLWGHHSFRRASDTVARATRERSGTEEEDIDIIFGWNERMYSRKMQHHYETRFNRDKRYRVTMYL